MGCEQVREQLSLYLYGELEAEPRAALEAHLASCAECAAALARERRLVELLGTRPPREPSPELLVECRSLLGEQLAEEALGWGGLLRAWFGGRSVPVASRALAVLAVLVLGFGAGWTLRSGAGPLETARAPEVASPWTAADLSGMRIAGIRQVATDPETGKVRLLFDAERRVALEGTLDDPRIHHLLIYAVKNYENPGIRRETLEALRGRRSDPDVRDALIYAALNDENAGVRLEAIDALRGLGWDEAIRTALVRVLERDANPGIRVAAINLLAEHADEAVVPVLRDLAANDANPYVRQKCAKTLRTVAGE